MASNIDSSDPYEIADTPLRDKEQRLVKELEGVRAARASIAVARQMGDGHPASVGEHSPRQTQIDDSPATTVVKGIVDGPYYGLGLAEAAIKCLSLRFGHTRTVKGIWKILSDAGVSILSDKPEAALNWALRKRERKVGDVLLVGNGEWGLPAWYPGKVEQIRAARNNASGRNHEEHVERTKAGMSFAKSRRGVKFGAKRKMTPEKIAEAKAMLEAGKSAREIAKHFGVAVSSIYGNKVTAERTAMKKKREGLLFTQ